MQKKATVKKKKNTVLPHSTFKVYLLGLTFYVDAKAISTKLTLELN